VSSEGRRARRLLRWYPRRWRENHADEFEALLEDSIAGRPFWPRRTIDIAQHGLRLRSAELRAALHASRRRVFLASSASLVVVVGALAVVTGGFGDLGATGPTKGQMPYEPGKTVPYSSIPDYISVRIGPDMTGYAPKAYVAARSGASGNSLIGVPAPVYASNLTTLLGHEYSGIGFVPLGKSPWSQPCRVETVTEVGESGATFTTVPCPSTTVVLPNVIGMVTPTGVAELSSLGVFVAVQNVPSQAVGRGHIVSTTPVAGSVVHARQTIVVDNSLR
jgi:hypothetical protein